jgi:hypothetical protein
MRPVFRSLIASAAFLTLSAALAAQLPPGYVMPRNIWLKASFKASMGELDIQKEAAVYYTNGKASGENRKARDFIRGSLGGHYNINDIGYYELGASQYLACCDMFALTPKPDQPMFLLYFNGNAAQVSYDEKKNTVDADLLREFRKLGWAPVETRLEEFLKHSPRNQDALAVNFSMSTQNLQTLASNSRINAMPPEVLAQAPAEILNRLGQQNANTLPAFIKALSMINGADSLDWMSNSSAHTSLAAVSMCTNAPVLTENIELQRAVNNLMDLIVKDIKRRPNSYFLYRHWASFASIAKNPDPRKLLDEVAFPPGSQKVYDLFSQLAEPFFNNPKVTKNLTLNVDEGFKFLHYAAEWIEEQGPPPDGIFSDAYARLAISTAQYMIQFRRHAELENYLHEIRSKSGSYWVSIVDGLKNPSFRSREQDISDLPRSTRARIDEILKLPPLDGGTKKQGGLVVSLETLELFINRNPDCHEAMDMYCAEAVKHLPDEELESKIYRYTAITHTPPPLWAYPKMGNKENWSALISRAIGEGLLRLNRAPSAMDMERNLWLNLSNWEDLDSEKNAIDWHGFLKNTEFWYDPMYYVQRSIMHEAVFAKYLSQAMKAGDWNSVFSACGARFQWDEKKCQNEKYLAAWKQAAEKLGKSL